MLRVLWSLTKGYRFHPWDSPYLKWRIETYTGQHADKIGFKRFVSFAWNERHNLVRYLHWAGRMRS